MTTINNMSHGLVDLSNTVKNLNTQVGEMSNQIDRLQSENQGRHNPNTARGDV